MGRKILSVTGNKPLNYLLKTSFQKDYNVITVNDISAGIAVLKATKNIELFIIDMDYKTQENIDFIKFISDSSLYAKPVIALSSSEEIIKEIDYEMIAYHFLKPFNPVNIIVAVDKLLQTKITIPV